MAQGGAIEVQFLLVISFLVLAFGVMAVVMTKLSPRVKGLLFYWGALLLELSAVFESPHSIALLVLVGVTLVAGAVTLFMLPANR